MANMTEERQRKLDALLDRALADHIVVTTTTKSPGLATTLRLALYNRARKRGIYKLRFKVRGSTVTIQQLADPE